MAGAVAGESVLETERPAGLLGRGARAKERSGKANIFYEPWRGLFSPATLLLYAAAGLAARAGFPGGVYPFGPALFGIVACSGRPLTTTLTGSIILLSLSTLMEARQTIAFAMAFLAAGALVSRTGPSRRGRVRSYAALPAIFIMLIRLGMILFMPGREGITPLAWQTILLEGALVILAVILLAPLAGILRNGWPTLLNREESVSLGLAAVVVGMGLSGLSLGPLQLVEVWNRLATMTAATLGSGAIGAALGTALGLLSNFAGGLPGDEAGLLGISGLLGGLFGLRRGRIGVVGGFVLGHLLVSAQAVSSAEIVAGFIYTALAAGLLFLLPDKLIRHLAWTVAGTKAAEELADARRSRLRLLAAERLEHIADLFGELSKAFAGEQIAAASAFSVASGSIPPYSSPPPSSPSSPSSPPPPSPPSREERWRREYRELVPRQLAGVAGVIRDIAAQTCLNTGRVEEMEIRVAEELSRRRIVYRCLEIRHPESDHPEISYISENPCDGRGRCALQGAAAVTAALVEKYTPWQGICLGKSGGCRVNLLPERPYAVTVRAAALAAGEEEISGDTCAQVELAGGKVAVILSDGMGTGPKAARESRAAVAMLQKMIEAGFEHHFAVQTVNSILLLRSPEETYATLDLAIIDLFSGELELWKFGSATSFICRSHDVEIVHSTSLPVGILSQVDVPVKRYRLQEGDMLVLLTDGVLAGGLNCRRGEEWLARLLHHTIYRAGGSEDRDGNGTPEAYDTRNGDGTPDSRPDRDLPRLYNPAEKLLDYIKRSGLAGGDDMAAVTVRLTAGATGRISAYN